MHDPDDTPLREDVRRLGALLGETIAACHGADALELIERVRKDAIAARKGEEAARARVLETLRGLDDDTAKLVARAFAQFLALANIAEQHHQVRRRRRRAASGAPPSPGSWDDTLPRLLAAGHTADQIASIIGRLEVELVLTAHPTEVNRRTVLTKHTDIAGLLDARDVGAATDEERAASERRLRGVIGELWGTDEILRRRPTPVEEARGGLYIFEQTLWDAVPRQLRAIDAAMRKHLQVGLPERARPLRFGSWMGGDRDGNPNVTPAVTEQVVATSTWMALDLYWREVDALRAELSLAMASDELLARTGPEPEPYRVVLGELRERIERARDACGAWLGGGEPAELPDVEEIDGELALLDRSLRSSGLAAVADGRLLDVRRQLRTFGLHLAPLDVRQDAAVHAQCLDEVCVALGLGSYASWDEAQRVAFLRRELASPRPLVPRAHRFSDEVTDCLDTFAVCARLPRAALGAYVISMAKRPSDVLAVYLLQKDAGIAEPMRVVPLFETLADLEGAGAAMRALLTEPVLQGRANAEVMLGYSDSAKDAGRLAASWALYRAQEDLVEVAKEANVELTLFHGRGGTPSRGGGPAWEAIRSQPAGAVDARVRVTEQGEVIQAKLGLPGIADRTLERTLSATVEATLAPPAPPSDAWRARMDTMAGRSKTAFRDVLQDARFVPYFREATVEPELSTLNIGSRPARRRKGGGIESLRAIPWVFAWNQCRLMLPAWLGAEVGLEKALADDEAELQAMAEGWPFFRTTLALISMALAKGAPEVSALGDEVLVEQEALAALGKQLRARFERARTAVMAARQQSGLLEDDEALRRSIDVRNPYVDPLSVLQVEVLRRYRADPTPSRLDALHVTINGIAAGIRNTG